MNWMDTRDNGPKRGGVDNLEGHKDQAENDVQVFTLAPRLESAPQHSRLIGRLH